MADRQARRPIEGHHFVGAIRREDRPRYISDPGVVYDPSAVVEARDGNSSAAGRLQAGVECCDNLGYRGIRPLPEKTHGLLGGGIGQVSMAESVGDEERQTIVVGYSGPGIAADVFAGYRDGDRSPSRAVVAETLARLG